ncbi:hypothetical protein [Chromobacterium phragmitis]|uniref:hypothetical protein n=1 Tax=Chromobacterium phragmitis TaxID=2202141 RepID=UPI0011AEAF7D|nr:hypothetical protein [Chromobacterium phragmitis]
MSMKPWQLAVFTAIGTLIGKAGYDLIIEDVKNNLIPKGWVAGTFSTTWSFLHETMEISRGGWYLYNAAILTSIIIMMFWGIRTIGDLEKATEESNTLKVEKNKLESNVGKIEELEKTIQELKKKIPSVDISVDEFPPVEKDILIAIAKIKNSGVDKILDKWIYEFLESEFSRLKIESAINRLREKNILNTYYSNGEPCISLTTSGLNILAKAH